MKKLLLLLTLLLWFPIAQAIDIERVKSLAAQGDVDAQYNLGVLYQTGQGVPKSDTKAFEWYRKAAEGGDAGAQYNLGLMYDNGHGVKRNHGEAARWISEAAVRKEPKALKWVSNKPAVKEYVRKLAKKGSKIKDRVVTTRQSTTGAQNQGGTGKPKVGGFLIDTSTPEDRANTEYGKREIEERIERRRAEKKAKAHAEARAQAKAEAQRQKVVAKAQSEVATALANTKQEELAERGYTEVEKDDAQTQAKAARNPEAEAQIRRAQQAYKAGDYDTARAILEPVAEQGYASAQHQLGQMYSKGHGVPQGSREALKWYRKAAEQGNADAQNQLGQMYSSGAGVPENYEESFKWYRQAAEQGDAKAQYNLALMYEQGLGVEQDSAKAQELISQAAEQGNALALERIRKAEELAQIQVGLEAYESGDYKTAFSILEPLGEQADAEVQYYLALMYEQGQGVGQDSAKAEEWYRKAAEQGHALALAWVSNRDSELAQAKAEAEARARAQAEERRRERAEAQERAQEERELAQERAQEEREALAIKSRELKAERRRAEALRRAEEERIAEINHAERRRYEEHRRAEEERYAEQRRRDLIRLSGEGEEEDGTLYGGSLR